MKVFQNLVKATTQYDYHVRTRVVVDGIVTVDEMSDVNCSNTKMRMGEYPACIDWQLCSLSYMESELKKSLKPKVIVRRKR